MKNSQALPLLHRNSYPADTDDELPPSHFLRVKQDKYYNRPKMIRIAYPPLTNIRAKENSHQLMIQSCISNKRYEDIWDENNEKKIRKELCPSSEGSRKLIEPLSYIGKQATIKHYNQYKKLDRTLLKKDYNAIMLSNGQKESIQLESPSVSLLQKAVNMQVLPLCLGLVKSKGEANILNLNSYNLGDRYIIALAAGLKKARMIQKCYLQGNRITDLGLAELVNSISPEVTILDLSNNKITQIDKRLIEMIVQPEYRLEEISFANNLLKEASADAIFKNAQYSRHLKKLNLNNNRLGPSCLDSLVEMIEKSTTLEQLYIGSNYLSNKLGERVFGALATNKYVKVLDYSLNQLGCEGGSCAKAISNCFRVNKTLEHVDLSFNNFGKEETEAIAEGLEPNKHIYGLHYRGNYGWVNSKGFIVLESKEVTLLDSIEQYRIQAFEVKAIRESNSLKSEVFKNVCWICEGWYEQEFRLTIAKTQNIQDKVTVYIHFDFQKYQPRLISLNQHQVRYITMVPPKRYRYFFTVNEQIAFDSHAPTEPLPFTELHSYEMNHQAKQIKVEIVHYRQGKARKIVNEWNELIVKTQPRMNGLVHKKQKEQWTFSKSVWAKQWRLDDEELLKKCFEKDWKNSKISNLIKNQTDQQKVKNLLWTYYRSIKSIYRQFASWSPFGEVWAVSSQPFTEFCQQSRIISKDTPLKIIDLTFITTNSMSGADWKGNPLVPQRGLVRFQFMESLVRLAEQKFKKNGVYDNFADSVETILKDHVESLMPQYNSNQWRLEKYFTEENDTLVKKYRPIFTAIYKRNSRLRLKPGEKPFMCLTEFRSIIERVGLNTYLTERDSNVSFNCAMMTQVDELETERFMKMTEIEFIEALVRCASSLPPQCTLEAELGPALHMQFEWMINQLKTLCPEDVRNQFPDYEHSIFVEQEQS